MRQGQQNRRGRGRNRKGQSPLARSFESTGPDVKIRGTPSHIAEKYMSLARDATSSGDPVLAENYLQHAEHYNRIIMAFRDQQIAQGGSDLNGTLPRARPFELDGDEFDDEGDDGDMQPPHQGQQPQMRHNDHQPRFDGQRFDGPRGGNDQNRYRGDRNNDHRNSNRNDNRNESRNDRGGERHERHDRSDQNGAPPPRPQTAEAGPEASGNQQPSGDQFRRRDRFPQQQHEQPEFLRRPVRRPRRESNGTPEANGAAPAPVDDADRD